jgi:Fe-S oxidoreductase
MWNVPQGSQLAFYALVPLVLVVLVAGAVWRIRKWFLGQAEPGTATPLQQLAQAARPQRLGELIRTALFQSRLAGDAAALLMHQAIFWGMLVLFLGTVLATIDQDVAQLLWGRQILSGRFYVWFEFALDIFGIALLAGVALAAYRRYVWRLPRLHAPPTGSRLWDAFPLLSLLGLVAITGFLVEGLRLAEGVHIERAVAAAPASRQARLDVLARLELGQRLRMDASRQAAESNRIAGGGAVFPAATAAPVGNAIGRALTGLPLEFLRLAHQGLWWGHALLALALVAGIPYTKAFHWLSSPAQLLLRHPAPAGRLPVVAETGIRTLRDCTWRQLLQVDACTWCGKCQDACPAYHAGGGLSPRDLVQAIGVALWRAKGTAPSHAAGLHGEVISATSLWACCTCLACQDVCPVHIEQPRLIVDLRRYLIEQGHVDEGLQAALMSLQRYGNTFGQAARQRPDWTQPLGFPLNDARRKQVDYLWFVGDVASFDPRAQQATRALAKLWQQAGVDLGLLMDQEQNSGNDVRRIGEEGLFTLLRENNENALAQASFRRVLTSDPHAFNTLKNEYTACGGESSVTALAGKSVVHYTQLLDDLLRQGRLRPARSLTGTVVTYHDPCYLGRYNGIYEAPRRVLRAIGARLLEMPRSRRNSFCCGAGGGRLWMTDTANSSERPAENRIKEALAVPGVQCLVVACPKDLVMFEDAVKTVGAERRLRIADLGELVWEACESPAAEMPEDT